MSNRIIPPSMPPFGVFRRLAAIAAPADEYEWLEDWTLNKSGARV